MTKFDGFNHNCHPSRLTMKTLCMRKILILTCVEAIDGDVDVVEAHAAWRPVGVVRAITVHSDQHVLAGSRHGWGSIAQLLEGVIFIRLKVNTTVHEV